MAASRATPGSAGAQVPRLRRQAWAAAARLSAGIGETAQRRAARDIPTSSAVAETSGVATAVSLCQGSGALRWRHRRWRRRSRSAAAVSATHSPHAPCHGCHTSSRTQRLSCRSRLRLRRHAQAAVKPLHRRRRWVGTDVGRLSTGCGRDESLRYTQRRGRDVLHSDCSAAAPSGWHCVAELCGANDVRVTVHVIGACTR